MCVCVRACVRACVCVGGVGLVIVLLGTTKFLVLQSSHRERKITSRFTLCAIECSVALPHGAVGWFTVCDCGVS